MPVRHTVKSGDCISSIAYENGLLPDRIWEHPDNAALKQDREDMHVLRPGDVVVVPDREPRQESVATGATHTFRRLAVPEILRVRFVDMHDEPRVGIAYDLEVRGVTTSGVTDDDGVVLEWVPPDAKLGKLTLRVSEEADDDEEYEIAIGQLVPDSEVAGVRARLTNLGYDCTDGSGETLDAATLAAVRAFQADRGLAISGELDERTREALELDHGS